VTIELVSTSKANAPVVVHPLVERLCAITGAPLLSAADYDAWASQPGRALVVFTEDPVQFRETLDVAVIVPELAQAFAGAFRVGVLLQAAGRTISTRYGFRRWPALVMLADGQYVGAIDGLRDWQEYIDDIGRLLQAPPTRAPTIGIAVTSTDAGGHCH